MRCLAIVVAMLALGAAPAQAQSRRPLPEQKKAEEKKPLVDEKAYKAALDRIPVSKEKYDPWGSMRPEPVGKKK
jgi:hypothetical protein